MSNEKITGRCAWLGQNMVDDTVWQHHMDDEELAEIDAALTTALDLKVNWKEIRKKHFPLNKLAEILKKASEELEEGSGIFRLRGLNLEKYSDLELRTLWMGISSYVGSACYQGHDG